MNTSVVTDITPLDALLTEAQAAAILVVSPLTMTAWRATNRTPRPAHCKVGGAIRYRRSDIDAFIASSVHK